MVKGSKAHRELALRLADRQFALGHHLGRRLGHLLCHNLGHPLCHSLGHLLCDGLGRRLLYGDDHQVGEGERGDGRQGGG